MRLISRRQSRGTTARSRRLSKGVLLGAGLFNILLLYSIIIRGGKQYEALVQVVVLIKKREGS
jgi:hypothetical protein